MARPRTGKTHTGERRETRKKWCYVRLRTSNSIRFKYPKDYYN